MPMSKHAFIVLLVASFASLTATGQEATPSVSGDDALKVMSFNIRNGKARDGANHWDKRQQLVVKTITNYSPDLLGTQETYEFQAEFLQQNLPDYSHVGRGRETAPEKGEQCTVFFKTSRFEKLAEGHFWLSPKPEQPGSKGWDAALPRMVTWVKLKDLRTGHSFVWFNTHFDHRGERARVQSARLLAQRAPNIADGHAFIITGDFNAGLESEPYQAMFTGNKPGTRVIDTFREIAENNDKPQGTFNGFKGTDTGARIDWIGASKQFQVLAAGIDKFEVNGQYPSDHFPVTATLGFGK
ncbi:MAG: endonuclease/exonuclease/phosphatase family protein [Mariniblastus sp.]|nr:endonuclease/exonuclease/phosphatase family protein [Mariniblastus sp.]